MNNTTKMILGLVLALIIFSGLYLSMASKSEAPQKTQTGTNQSSPTASPTGQTILSMTPNPLVVEKTGSSQMLNVTIQADQEKITAAQIELSYDPKLITNVDIVPGTFFTNPTVLLKEIDSKNGRVSYAIGVPPAGVAKTGSGIIANISFTPIGKNQSTQISFLQKTLTSAEGMNYSTLKSATGATIILPE